MNQAFLIYDLRRSFNMLLAAWLAATGFVLLLPGPLPGGLPGVMDLIGLLVGILLAIQLMSDMGGTQAYVYSRGLPRRRVILLRFFLGITIVMGLGLSIWSTLAFGLRESVHVSLRMSDAIYYPMSAQFERSLVVPFVMRGISSFGVTCLSMTWRGLCSPAANSTSRGVAGLVMTELPVGLLMIAIFLGTSFVSSRDESSTSLVSRWILWLPVGVSAVSLIGAWITSRDLEVQ